MKNREVIFIRSLNVEKARMLNSESLTYYDANFAVPVGDEYIRAEDKINQRVVPITKIVTNYGSEEMYIAYSEEVERMLGLPVRLMCEELNAVKALLTHAEDLTKVQAADLRAAETWVTNVREASLWTRIKYLFTRKF